MKVTNPLGNDNKIWCNGAFVNRKFIIASKKCVEKIPLDDMAVLTYDSCYKSTEEKSAKEVQNVHKFKGCSTIVW